MELAKYPSIQSTQNPAEQTNAVVVLTLIMPWMSLACLCTFPENYLHIPTSAFLKIYGGSSGPMRGVNHIRTNCFNKNKKQNKTLENRQDTGKIGH
jgi:hypothetical protein